MDVAVFSDIHSNHIALQTCFDYCVSKGITRFILLGDYVTDGPFPDKTLELLYMLRQYFKCTFIRGNREQYLLDYRKKGEEGWKNGSASGSLLYTFEHLSVRDLNFFSTMPIYAEWKEEGFPPIEVCHGSPTSVSELLFKDKRNTRKVMSEMKTDYLVRGHNHLQDAFSYRDKQCWNPGALGQPWHHDGKSQFMILHSDGREWEYEMMQLEYDREALFKEFEESGLMEKAPAWCALIMYQLRTGIDIKEAVLLRAMQLCREERGEANWPDIPEIFWAFALRERRIDLFGRPIPTAKKQQ